jgi:hypothetical protein
VQRLDAGTVEAQVDAHDRWNQVNPYVIAVNSVSGGGKTTLSRLLKEKLSATMFCFDDFDDTNVHPDSMYDWYNRGADITEFDCPGMRVAVLNELRQPMTRHIVLDYPFGRDHPCFSDTIDLSVYIDTPLDIAMARRILRDYGAVSESAEEASGLSKLLAELTGYEGRARRSYLEAKKHGDTCDLVLDGCGSAEDLRDQVILKLNA